MTAGLGLLVTLPADGQTITRNELLGAVSGDGFADLAALDTNGDGVIDASDAAYQTLGVWQDANADGSSDAGELYSLSSLGIKSISVNATATTENDNGNIVLGSGSFTLSGSGGTHEIAEVDFATDRQNTTVPSTSNTPIDPAAAELPNLAGYGSMPDLQQAMSIDPTLLSEVQALVSNSGTLSAQDFDAAFEQMVQQWAGAEDIDPTSDGAYVDARHMAVIYATYGIDPNADPAYQTQPNAHNGPAVWEPLYQDIIAELKTRFVSQISGALDAGGADSADQLANPYRAFSFLDYDASTDRFGGDIASTFKYVKALEPEDEAAASVYWQTVEPLLAALRVDVVSPQTLLEDAVWAHFSTAEISSLAADLGISIDVTDGVVTLPGATTVFYADSGDTMLAPGWQNITLPDYDPTTTAFYQAAGSSDLIIENLPTGSKLTVANFFDGGASADGAINVGDGTTYFLSSVGHLLAATAVAQIEAAGDEQGKEDALAGLNYTVASDPSTATSVTGSVAYDVNTTSPMTIDCNGWDQRGNVIFFSNGTSPGDLEVRQGGDSGTDLILTNRETGQTITLSGQGGDENAHIESVVFEDGTVWSAEALWAQSEQTGTSEGAALITGAYGQNNLVAGAGAVELRGDFGSTYTTGAGNDIIDVLGDGNTINVSASTVTVDLKRHPNFYDQGVHQNNVVSLDASFSSDGLKIAQDSSTASIMLTFTDGRTINLDGILEDYDSGITAVTTIKFADGETLSLDQLVSASIDAMEALGNDTVICLDAGGRDSFTAGSGNVVLDGSLVDNVQALTLEAGTGSDTLIGSGKINTVYVIPSSADRVVLKKYNDAGTSNTISFRSGISPTDIGVWQDANGDYTFFNKVTGGEVELQGGLSDDTSRSNIVDQVQFGDGTIWTAADIRSHIQTVQGTSQNDTLEAPDGDVTLIGGGGSDTLIAGSGSDQLVGGGGVTSFVVNAAAGAHDVIDATGSGSEVQIPGSTFVIGQLDLHGISASDVSVALDDDGSDVDLTVAGTGQTMRLVGEATDAPVVNGISFDDGTVWRLSDIDSKAGIETNPLVVQGTINDDVLQAGAGDVSVYGNGGDDTLIAGEGNDTLIGGPTGNTLFQIGSDAYRYTVQARDLMPGWKGGEQSSGVLDLSGVDTNAVQVTAASNGQDALLTIAGTGETILLQDELTNTPVVTNVNFDDGSSWSAAEIANMASNPGGSSGPSVVQGTSNDDVLQAGAGDVTIYGNGGNDTFLNGPGNDLFAGSDGTETYKVGLTGGNVTIQNDPDPGAQNILSFGNGIAPSDIKVTQSSDGTALALTDAANGQSVLLEGQLQPAGSSSYSQTSVVEFADGTTWSASDLLAMSVSSAEAAGNISIYGDRGDNTLQAPAYDANLFGDGGNDTFINGSGNDVFVGSDGIETYKVGLTEGNVTIENDPASDAQNAVSFGDGIAPSDIEVTQSPDGTEIDLTDTVDGQSVQLVGQLDAATPFALAQTNTVEFDDGTTWSAADLLSKSVSSAIAAGSTSIYGDRGDNTLQAPDYDVTLSGNGGNDTLISGAGNDTLIGGGGYTTFQIAASSSSYVLEDQAIVPQWKGGSLYGNGGALYLSGVDAASVSVEQTADGSGVILSVAGSGEQVTLVNELTANPVVNDVFFDDGTDWQTEQLSEMAQPPSGSANARGAAAANMSGSSGAADTSSNAGSTVTSGTGDDTLVATAGPDTFQFHPDFGHDTVTGFSAVGETYDVLAFDSTVFSDWAHVLGATKQVGSDLVITVDPADSITLKDVSISAFSQNNVQFV